MIHVIRADERHFTDFDWLKTYWLFSFAEYYDPANIQFGALRVFNDDVVAPHTGFGTHAHEEMEIITIVLDGAVTHEDSIGTKAVMRAGDVQRMSAGTGIRHSEFNLGEVPAHFYQIWIYPDTRGLPPSYDQKSFAGTVWTNRLVPVASGQGLPEVVTFHTDATLYLGALESQRSVTHNTDGTRRVFVYMTEGELTVDGAQLHTKDQARIDPEAPLGSHTACDTGHGRLTTREGQCLSMQASNLAPRWSESGVHTLVVMQRETVTLATQKTPCETAYYSSNQALGSDPQAQALELTRAIREHWHVESDNWIRDVTLNEDHVKTQSAHQAQVMGCLRSVAMRLLRRFNVRNFQEALEDFADCPGRFEALLRRVNFL